MDKTNCIKCGHTFGFNEAVVQVRIPNKPKGSPYRFKEVGYACDNDKCDKCDDIGYTIGASHNDICTDILYKHSSRADGDANDQGLFVYKFKWNGAHVKTVHDIQEI